MALHFSKRAWVTQSCTVRMVCYLCSCERSSNIASRSSRFSLSSFCAYGLELIKIKLIGDILLLSFLWSDKFTSINGKSISAEADVAYCPDKRQYIY
jgi:hypothetical protein